MIEEHHELIIELMAEKIKELEGNLRDGKTMINFYRGYSQELEEKIQELKPKLGRPVKKRGRGRPKGSRNV
jgi:prefoldin subunit 5